MDPGLPKGQSPIACLKAVMSELNQPETQAVSLNICTTFLEHQALGPSESGVSRLGQSEDVEQAHKQQDNVHVHLSSKARAFNAVCNKRAC